MRPEFDLYRPGCFTRIRGPSITPLRDTLTLADCMPYRRQDPCYSPAAWTPVRFPNDTFVTKASQVAKLTQVSLET